MLKLILLCVVLYQVSGDVQQYRSVIHKDGHKQYKEISFDEDDEYAVIKISKSKGHTREEMYDFKTGYAASKNKKCYVFKSHYTMDDMKNSLVGRIKKNPKANLRAIYREQGGKRVDDVVGLAGTRIAHFCGSLEVIKARPKRTRNGNSEYRHCLLWCW